MKKIYIASVVYINKDDEMSIKLFKADTESAVTNKAEIEIEFNKDAVSFYVQCLDDIETVTE